MFLPLLCFAGDQAKIDSYKKDIRNNSTTSKLVAEGGLSTVLLCLLRFVYGLNLSRIQGKLYL